MTIHPARVAVPARVTRGALVAHRHSFAPPRCRTSQYRRSFEPLSVSLWNDPSDPVFDGGLAYSLFFSPAKTTLLGQGYGFCWWQR